MSLSAVLRPAAVFVAQAEVDEEERVESIKREIEEAKLNGTFKEGTKNPSKRPDRYAAQLTDCACPVSCRDL
jgi:hypothetical protein